MSSSNPPLVGARFGDDWWQRGVIYQVYPRSFADSDGDGVGDLPGIIAHLDYLGPDGLGIDAIWLSAIYPSPGLDLGYGVGAGCRDQERGPTAPRSDLRPVDVPSTDRAARSHAGAPGRLAPDAPRQPRDVVAYFRELRGQVVLVVINLGRGNTGWRVSAGAGESGWRPLFATHRTAVPDEVIADGTTIALRPDEGLILERLG